MAAHQAALIAVVGPTASGKSALALELGRERDGEIVSCDSLQIYRGLDVGSAKPGASERELVPHHLIDVAEPDADFSAADYAAKARSALREIADRGRLPIIVGGAGLYLRALLAGLFSGPSRDAAFRERVEAIAARFGRARVHRWLRGVDPAAAARIEVNDLVRTMRALEVFATTRRPLSEHHAESREALTGFRIGVFGLALDRAELRRRVEARTDAMFGSGLLDEARGLIRRFPEEPRPLRAIGYRQAVSVLRGEIDVVTARRDIVTATMQYAKRQRTWFRHQADVEWSTTAAEARRKIEAWLEARA